MVSCILDSIDKDLLVNEPPSVSDRYYDHRYCTNVHDSSVKIHQRLSFHTNRVCVVSLAHDHPVIRDNKLIVKINCKVDEKTDRLQNSVSGKGKRGAQKLRCDSVICYIECSDNTVYPVLSCIVGKLIEVNKNLLENPNLLKEKPKSEGYIALLLPTLSLYEKSKNSGLSLEEYLETSAYCRLV